MDSPFYVKYLLLCFFISLFGLSAILKIRNGEHTYYVGLVVAYNWNREKQMFVALGKEFDMLSKILYGFVSVIHILYSKDATWLVLYQADALSEL